MAIPGTIVNSGNLVTPGGDQGLTGTPSWTTCTAAFAVPAVGSTVSVTVANATWMVVGEVVWVQNANAAGTGAAPFRVQSISGNTVVLLNVSTSGQTLGDMLRSVYDTNGNNIVDQAEMVPDPAIAGVIIQRTRGTNIIHNPNFEVDQRNCNGAVNYPAGTSTQLQCDRWQVQKNAATAVTGAQVGATSYPNTILIPGSPIGNRFGMSRSYLGFNVSTAQATLAAGEYLNIAQFIEGSQFREVSADVFSISILCWANVALNFALFCRDNGNSNSLVIPCSIPANIVTLLTFPNLPVWPNGGNFSIAPGVLAGTVGISLACGTASQTSTTGSWVSGNMTGYPGMSNFLASTTNAFQVRFVQLEPGPLCTTLIDKPFSQNLDECLRYFQKSYLYGTAIGSAVQPGMIWLMQNTGAGMVGPVRFHKTMAKTPTITPYNYSTGAANSIFHVNGTSYAVSSINSPGDSGFTGVQITSPPTVAAGFGGFCQYICDTGW